MVRSFGHAPPDAAEKKKRTAQSLVLVFSFLVFSFSSPNKSHAKVDIYMNQKKVTKKKTTSSRVLQENKGGAGWGRATT